MMSITSAVTLKSTRASPPRPSGNRLESPKSHIRPCDGWICLWRYLKVLRNFGKKIPMLATLVQAERTFIHFMRIAIFTVMAWIGGLKAFQYEADGIVPFVANSPLMSFFYTKEAPEYQAYKNPEGLTVQKNIDWHRENGTYLFSYALGTVILLIGLLTLA